MRFALIGQPNAGKSTLFNQVAGYRAETGNFPGTTVAVTESRLRVQGQVVDLADLPGTYALSGTNPAEQVVQPYLESRDVDVIINVLDATRLEPGLALTMELLELDTPVVVAVNVLDEAARLGIRIDGPRLQSLLGVPVLPLVASKGRGVRALFLAALRQAQSGNPSGRIAYGEPLDRIRAALESRLSRETPAGASRDYMQQLLRTAPAAGVAGEPSPEVERALSEARAQIEAETGLAVDEAFRRGRSQSASRLAQSVILRHAPRPSWRDRLDEVLLHPRLGYLALLISLLLLFEFVFLVGSALEGPLLAMFEALVAGIAPILPPSTLLGAVVGGAIQGIAGGLAIVLPYLVPFLLGLSFLEDVGYLPRVAFLMDSLMRRLGLDGKAVVPFILGYGCTVPAVMSTRIMEDSRQRSLAAALTTLLPCAARLSIVFGLVAFHLGPGLALAIFLADLVLVAAIARAVSYLLSQDQPGLILEMPAYRIPSWRGLTAKLLVRLRDFVLHAWPILIIGSMVLAALVFFGLDDFFNLLVRPFTWVLGLPAATGVPLIFGVLRKELSLVMLGQALGSPDFSASLTATQMLTFTTFVVLYLPCLATLSVLHHEFGRRQMLVISALSVALALVCAIVVRLASSLLLV